MLTESPLSLSPASTAHQQVETEFPLIDSDPHFKRVISYMRPSDYVAWGSATVGFPSALYLMGAYVCARRHDLD